LTSAHGCCDEETFWVNCPYYVLSSGFVDLIGSFSEYLIMTRVGNYRIDRPTAAPLCHRYRGR
jgi:hypothetical protein